MSKIKQIICCEDQTERALRCTYPDFIRIKMLVRVIRSFLVEGKDYPTTDEVNDKKELEKGSF